MPHRARSNATGPASDIREDIIHAVRTTGLDPTLSARDHQRFLDQVGEALGEMAADDDPIGSTKIIPVQPALPPAVGRPALNPGGTLFD